MSFVPVVVNMNFLPMFAETPWFAPAMFALGCGLLVAILLRRSWRQSGKRARGGSGPALDAQARPKHTWDGAEQDAAARFDRQQVELNDLARDLTGQIDSKLVLLQQLLAQSDERIQRLETLLREADVKTGDGGDGGR